MVNRLVAVDDNFNLPPEVQAQLTSKFEAEFQTAHDEAVQAALDADADAVAAANSADSAESSAVVAQEAAATATAPTDVAVDEGIDRAVSAGKIVRGVDLISKLKASGTPIIVAHRGGTRIHPEHTLVGYRDTFQSGFILETDIRRLSTGQLVNIHDATTGRTMTGADTAVNTMTFADWKSRRVLPRWKGGKEAAPSTWNEVLDEFGNRTVIMAEVKDNDAVLDIINSVKERGLERSVILQSFTYSIVQQINAAGCCGLALSNATPTATVEQMVTDGVEFMGPSLSVTAATIAPYRAAGIKVVPYTVEVPADWTAAQAKNVDGAFFNDPWGATGRYGRQNRDPFGTSTPWYGWASWAGSHNPSNFPVNYQTSQGGLWFNGLAYAGTLSCKQSWAPPQTPVSGTSVLRFRARLSFDSAGGGTTGSSSRWAGVFFGTTPDGQAFVDQTGGAPGQSGYHFLFRRSGGLDIFRVDPNASAVLLAQNTTPTSALSNVNQVNGTEVEIIINGNGLRIRRLDNGDTVNFSDGTYRSNLELHLTGNQTNLYWSNVSYDMFAPSEIGY